MRDARYVRLISWTLQSGSKHLGSEGIFLSASEKLDLKTFSEDWGLFWKNSLRNYFVVHFFLIIPSDLKSAYKF
jgi:hypothetical protein